MFEVKKVEFDDKFYFENYITLLNKLIVQFKSWFEEVKLMRSQINLFNNPFMSIETKTKKQKSTLHLKI